MSYTKKRGILVPQGDIRHRFLNTGYGNHGASRGKTWEQGWDWYGGSPHEDINQNLSVLRQRSRDLDMGGGFARGAIRTMRTNIVGAGLKVSPQPDGHYLGMSDDAVNAWQRNVIHEFNMWALGTNCDADRQNNFYELQQLAQLSWLASGDAFVIPMYLKRPNNPYELCLRVVEADRICTPGRPFDDGTPVDAENGGYIISGVEISKSGEVAAYHIASAHPLSSVYTSTLKWTRVEAFGAVSGRANIYHLMEHERPEQRRGVPYLAPVIEEVKQLARYVHAEQMSAVVASKFSVFVNTKGHRETGEGYAPGERKTLSPFEYELGNGTLWELEEDEDIKTANPNRTNTAFESFVTAMCLEISASTEIPYEVLIRRFNSSYSASRAALLEFWKVIRMRREWLVNDFCQPVYEEFLIEAVAKGRVTAPGFFDDPAVRLAYMKAVWHGPTPGQLDPRKEVEAADMRVASGYSTRQREAAEMNGTDFEDNLRQIAKENRQLQEAGISITNTGGVGIAEPYDKEMLEDGFESISGASGIRGYYRL